jgi:hypothetical protein
MAEQIQVVAEVVLAKELMLGILVLAELVVQV